MFSLSRFQQVVQLVPWAVFDQAVIQHGNDRHCKGFSSQRQLKAMMYAQLSGAGGLRELEASFNPHTRQHYHLGMEAIRRSTLSDANTRRSPQPFAAAVAALMRMLGREVRREQAFMTYLLDSTTIRLAGRGFEWTEANATRDRGLKVHVLYGAQTQHVAHQRITAVNVNDLEEGRRLRIEPGATYVFDKAYCDYSWWAQLNAGGARFVTRAKRVTALELLNHLPIVAQDQGTILSDSIEKFKYAQNRGGHHNNYTGPIRRIQVARENDESLWLLTNDLDSPAAVIADLYRQRWGIELFFKWIKQHLQVKRFIGRSQNAVTIQLLVALIVYLLVLLYKRRCMPQTSLWHALADLRHGLLLPIEPARSSWQRRREYEALKRSIQPQLL